MEESKFQNRTTGTSVEKVPPAPTQINTFGLFTFSGIFFVITALLFIVFPAFSPIRQASSAILLSPTTLIATVFFTGTYLLIYKSYEPVVVDKAVRMLLSFGVILAALIGMLLGYSYYVLGFPFFALIYMGLSAYLVAAVFEDLMTAHKQPLYYLSSRIDMLSELEAKYSFLDLLCLLLVVFSAVFLIISMIPLQIGLGVLMIISVIAFLAAAFKPEGRMLKVMQWARIINVLAVLGYGVFLAIADKQYLVFAIGCLLLLISIMHLVLEKVGKSDALSLTSEQIEVLKFRFETEKIIWVTISIIYFFAVLVLVPEGELFLPTLTAVTAAAGAYLIYHLLPTKLSTRVGVFVEVEAFQVVVLLVLLSSNGLFSPFIFLLFLPVVTAVWGVPSRWMFAPIFTSFFTVGILWWTSRFPGQLWPIDVRHNAQDSLALVYFLAVSIMGGMSTLLLGHRDKKEARLQELREELEYKEQALSSLYSKERGRSNKLQQLNTEISSTKKSLEVALDDVKVGKAMIDRENLRFIKLLGEIGYGVLHLDSEGKIIEHNTIAEMIVGARQFKNKPYGEILIFQNEAGDVLDPVKEALQGKFRNLGEDSVFVRSDGKLVPVEASASPLKTADKGVIGAMVIMRDVTEEREAMRVKSDFVSITSHQLRTPLTSLKWNLEMLYTGEEGKMKASQKKIVFDAYENAKQMSDLVNDLLNVTSIESGKLQVAPEPIDVVKVAETSIAALSGMMKEKGVSITLMKPTGKVPSLLLDKWLITRAIDNLLSNAVKYTPKGGKITVKIEKGDSELVVSVADNGIGIPSSLQRNVFKKFFRARQAMTIAPEGTGLGLYIAKFAVSKFGGKIWFESEEGKGSTFYFTVPLRGQPSKDVRKTPGPAK